MEWTRRSMHTERRHRTEWEVPCKAMGLELLRISPPPSLPLLPSTHPCSAYPPPTRPCLPSPPLVSFQGSLDLYPGPACAQQHKSNARLRIQLLMILHFFLLPPSPVSILLYRPFSFPFNPQNAGDYSGTNTPASQPQWPLLPLHFPLPQPSPSLYLLFPQQYPGPCLTWTQPPRALIYLTFLM